MSRRGSGDEDSPWGPGGADELHEMAWQDLFASSAPPGPVPPSSACSHQHHLSRASSRAGGTDASGAFHQSLTVATAASAATYNPTACCWSPLPPSAPPPNLPLPATTVYGGWSAVPITVSALPSSSNLRPAAAAGASGGSSPWGAPLQLPQGSYALTADDLQQLDLRSPLSPHQSSQEQQQRQQSSQPLPRPPPAARALLAPLQGLLERQSAGQQPQPQPQQPQQQRAMTSLTVPTATSVRACSRGSLQPWQPASASHTTEQHESWGGAQSHAAAGVPASCLATAPAASCWPWVDGERPRPLDYFCPSAPLSAVRVGQDPTLAVAAAAAAPFTAVPCGLPQIAAAAPVFPPPPPPPPLTRAAAAATGSTAGSLYPLSPQPLLAGPTALSPLQPQQLLLPPSSLLADLSGLPAFGPMPHVACGGAWGGAAGSSSVSSFVGGVGGAGGVGGGGVGGESLLELLEDERLLAEIEAVPFPRYKHRRYLHHAAATWQHATEGFRQQPAMARLSQDVVTAAALSTTAIAAAAAAAAATAAGATFASAPVSRASLPWQASASASPFSSASSCFLPLRLLPPPAQQQQQQQHHQQQQQQQQQQQPPAQQLHPVLLFASAPADTMRLLPPSSAAAKTAATAAAPLACLLTAPAGPLVVLPTSVSIDMDGIGSAPAVTYRYDAERSHAAQHNSTSQFPSTVSVDMDWGASQLAAAGDDAAAYPAASAGGQYAAAPSDEQLCVVAQEEGAEGAVEAEEAEEAQTAPKREQLPAAATGAALARSLEGGLRAKLNRPRAVAAAAAAAAAAEVAAESDDSGAGDDSGDSDWAEERNGFEGGDDADAAGRRGDVGMDGGGGGKGAGGRRARALTMDDLRAVFHLPIGEAGRALGFSATELKRRCRGLGFSRWPQRKLVSLRRMAEAAEADASLSLEKKQWLKASVARSSAAIMEQPDTPLEDLHKTLRQAQYKKAAAERASDQHEL